MLLNKLVALSCVGDMDAVVYVAQQIGGFELCW